MYYSFKKSLVALVAILFLVGVVAAVMPRVSRGQGNSQNAPPPFDVKVINSPSEPVPVTGTVGITGTPAFRNLDEPGRSPYVSQTLAFTTTISCITTGGGFQDCTLGGFKTVTAGKRLVIKDFSGQIREPAGCKPFSIGINGETTVIAIPRPSLAIADGYDFHESVLNYVNAGNAPTVDIHSSCAGLNVNLQFVAITGYLVDVP